MIGGVIQWVNKVKKTYHGTYYALPTRKLKP